MQSINISSATEFIKRLSRNVLSAATVESFQTVSAVVVILGSIRGDRDGSL